MRILKTQFFLICIFLCVILSTNRITASDYFLKAMQMYSGKHFYDAALEFERAVYYETDYTKVANYKYYKSLCYKNLENPPKALEELNGINFNNLPDTLYYKIRYEQAYCNLLNNEPVKALWSIDEIIIRFPDSLTNKEIMPLKVLTFNALGRWGESKELWREDINNRLLPDSVKLKVLSEVESLYNKKSIPKRFSARKAENLSRFIPGSGQVYCGEFLEGSFNFLINAAILSFAAYEFYTRYYFTGYFVGLGLLNKTYNGGMHRAKNLAEEKNLEEIRSFNEKSSALMIKIIRAEMDYCHQDSRALH